MSFKVNLETKIPICDDKETNLDVYMRFLVRKITDMNDNYYTTQEYFKKLNEKNSGIFKFHFYNDFEFYNEEMDLGDMDENTEDYTEEMELNDIEHLEEFFKDTNRYVYKKNSKIQIDLDKRKMFFEMFTSKDLETILDLETLNETLDLCEKLAEQGRIIKPKNGFKVVLGFSN